MFLIQLHSEKQDWMLHLNVLRVFMIRLSELGQAIASWVPGGTTAGHQAQAKHQMAQNIRLMYYLVVNYPRIVEWWVSSPWFS